MQNIFIDMEQNVLKRMKSRVEQKESEFKKEGFLQRFSQTKEKIFIKQISAAFSKV
ncbi:Uncharacterised protein [Legionella oakridgensis]|uniref:Uncharacterized protein n=1 Tax=Legionella longbeachae serogroup 1 (strain NSW150) TaxID=661367 RepID=D3HNB7_LEGLN|nr:hypothetical protein LLB_1832 [Legionella longbeachae D-4968]CBJ10379.1 hypothetical protein LLO_0055 [Legionella longbeachae NSW150]VEE00906.1 Uncharacterised protein [Legionella oakridgensis]